MVVGGSCVGSEEGCTLVSTISGRVTSRLLIFTRIDELPNDVGVLQMLRTFKLDDNKLGTLTQDLTQHLTQDHTQDHTPTYSLN